MELLLETLTVIALLAIPLLFVYSFIKRGTVGSVISAIGAAILIPVIFVCSNRESEASYIALDKTIESTRINRCNNPDVEEIKEEDTTTETEESLTEEEIIEKINSGEVDVYEGEIVYDEESIIEEPSVDAEEPKLEEQVESSFDDEEAPAEEPAANVIEEDNSDKLRDELPIGCEGSEPSVSESVVVSEPVVAPAGGIFTDSLTDGTAANVIIDEGVTDAQKIEFFSQYNLIPYAMRKDLMDMGQPIHLTTSPAMTEGHAGTAYAMYECYIYVGKKNAIKIATIHEFGHLIDALIANRTGYQESGAFYSENARFVDIYSREKAQSGFPSYASDCVEDYFAEAFMYYHQNRSKLDNVPETKQYIHDLILVWYGIEY